MNTMNTMHTPPESERLTVVKVGGNELDDPHMVARLCRDLAALERPLVLVHGGGKEISAALERYGQSVEFVEGLRVTPPESMAIMEMVVCGSINKRLVARLVSAGRQALGLSGVDLGLVRAVPYRPEGLDLGRVGQVTAVRIDALLGFVAAGHLPVIAPVALGQDDHAAYNINADHMALGIAEALAQHTTRTVELVFVSNVPGVLLDGQVAAHLSAAAAEEHIRSGAISGGMIPKVRSALAALAAGVREVRIGNLDSLTNGGTAIGGE
jgi:acetylglutamate kinase